MTNTLEEMQTSIIDSRDLIEALDEWQAIADDDEYSEEEREEAQKNADEIEAFCAPFEGYSDWQHGETLIEEEHFIDYIKELLQDIGDLPSDLPSYLVIDWDATADNLAHDYMLDNGYYMRAH